MSAHPLGPSSNCLHDQAAPFSAPSVLPSALGVGRELRLLIHVNLVPVQVLERHSDPVGLHFGLTLESHAGVLHALILTHALVGLDGKEWLRTALPTDEGQFLVR